MSGAEREATAKIPRKTRSTFTLGATLAHQATPLAPTNLRPPPLAIPAGVHLPNAPVREVQPGDHDEVIAGSQPVESGPHVRIEHQPAVGRAFVALAWGGREMGEGRLDPANRM